MQIQIWSQSRATPKGTSTISLTQQSSVCLVSPSSGEMFISMGFCSPRCMSEDNSGMRPVRCEEGLRPPLCKSHLLHRYHVATCKYKAITLNFSIACDLQPLSLPVNWSWWDPPAGTGPPQQDLLRAHFNPAPHPTIHATVGVGSKTSVPQ